MNFVCIVPVNNTQPNENKKMQPVTNPGTSGETTNPAATPAGMKPTPGTQYADKPGIPGCIRKMSRCERLFFMNPACTVMMAARITGTVDEIPFRQVLEAAARKHPLLRAKVVFDERHEAWFSNENVPPVPLRILERTSDQQWLAELKEEARVPFAIDREPLIRCVLIRSPEVSDLLILCNHSICDGMALAILVRDILTLYANPLQDVRVLAPPDVLDIVKPGLSIKGLIARLFIGMANRKWRKNPHYFGPEEYAALYRGYWEARRPGLVLLEFNPEESARLLSACREHGVTVGSAVSAACLAAYADVTGGFTKSQQAIMVPYDLRRRIDPPLGDVFCFCDGGVRFPFAYSTKKPFWDNAHNLHKEIHSRIKILDPSCLDIPEFEPSLTDALSAFSLFTDKVPEAYARTETLQQFIRDTGNVASAMNRNFEKNIPGFVPSNLGRIDVPESPAGLSLDRLVFLPSASEINPLILGGAGAGGRMVFTLPFVDPPAKTGISPEPELIRIRNRVLEILGFSEKVHPDIME